MSVGQAAYSTSAKAITPKITPKAMPTFSPLDSSDLLLLLTAAKVGLHKQVSMDAQGEEGVRCTVERDLQWAERNWINGD